MGNHSDILIGLRLGRVDEATLPKAEYDQKYKELMDKRKLLPWGSDAYKQCMKEIESLSKAKAPKTPVSGSGTGKGYKPHKVSVSKADFIDSLETYTAEEGYDMNSILRGVSTNLSTDQVDELKRHIDNVSSALSKASLSSDMTLYRGASLAGLKQSTGVGNFDNLQDLVGKTFQEIGFSSASPTLSTALGYNKGVLLHINLPSGAKAVETTKLLPYSDSIEVTIQHNSLYTITKAEKDKGIIHVYMDYVRAG